jgi:hypothetical protein
MPTHAEAGQIAIFNRVNGIWRRDGRLPCPPRACLFAQSVVLRDNVAVVAGFQSVLVFRREQGEWRLKEQIDPPGGRPSDPTEPANVMHRSVQYQDGLMTAAYASDDAAGALYVYELDSAARVKSQVRLSASDAAAGDYFGYSVSMARDTIVVGAPDDGRGGSVYVFRRRGGEWIETQKLQASDHEGGNTFGFALAINKGHILVGAPNLDSAGAAHLGNERGGWVYHFTPVDGVWVQQAKFRPTTREYPNYTDFGRRIVMFGERAIIAATPTPFAPPGESVVFEYVRTGMSFRPVSVARTRSPGGVALSNHLLMLGSPWEDTTSGIGHVALYALNQPPVAARYCETQPLATFCDDFTSGTAERWQTEGGVWSVENQEYVGRGEADVCGTGFSSNQSRIPNLSASDVDVSVTIRSLEGVDKGLVLRSTNLGDQIELNFRADPFNELIVQELRDCQFILLESGFALPQAMQTKTRFRAKLVGTRLSVWMNDRLILSRSFPFTATAGGVGLSVIDGGLAAFDDVRVRVLQ